VVCARDGVDDCQAEAGAVAAVRLVAAAKALEGVRREVLAEPVARVGDVDLDAIVGVSRPDLHAAGAVAQGVVEQVAEGLLKAGGVGTQPQGLAGDLDRATLMAWCNAWASPPR
jgi:hypothetical protein